MKKGKNKKLRKLDIFVIRISANGELVNARPCYNCLDMMRAVGIRRVYYSIDGSVICENVSHMVSINSSSVLRFLERTMYNAPMTDNEYFKRLLAKKLPNTLRRKNIYYLINYNLNDVLPDFTFKIKKNEFIIYDENNYILHKVKII